MSIKEKLSYHIYEKFKSTTYLIKGDFDEEQITLLKLQSYIQDYIKECKILPSFDTSLSHHKCKLI